MCIYRLSWLPVWEDTDEAPHVYGYLCHLIENNHPVILGPSNANLPKLIAIIAEAFLRDAIATDHVVAQKMLNIVRQIQVKHLQLMYLSSFRKSHFVKHPNSVTKQTFT